MSLCRVATSLEYSGISLNIEKSWNSVQPQGKIVTNMKYMRDRDNILVFSIAGLGLRMNKVS